jgi:transposase
VVGYAHRAAERHPRPAAGDGRSIPQGARRVLPGLSAAFSHPSSPIPDALHEALLSAAKEIRELEGKIRMVEHQLEALAQTLPAVERLRTVPGIRLLSSTALIAVVGDPSRFPSGRRFASYFGLVPRERSSGPSRHLGAITKRGDAYLRTLADPWSPLRPLRRQTLPAERSPASLGTDPATAPRAQPDRGRPGQQARSHRLGRLEPRYRISSHPTDHRLTKRR